MLLDVFKDTVVDTLKVIPFLFLTYLLMEWNIRQGEKQKPL